MDARLIGIRFAIHETPCCFWEVDLDERNREFITGFQHDYFQFLADMHVAALNGPRPQLAAMSLRSAYGQGLETLFALLFATLQAPDCVVGWMPRYRQDDLQKLVAAIDGNQPILSKIALDSPTWEGVVTAIHRHVQQKDAETAAQRTKQVSRLWRYFAKDFLSEEATDEYNTIKHGFRGHPGGFQMRIAAPLPDGSRPPENQFHTMDGSDFGSSFFGTASLGAKYHFKVRRIARNWAPQPIVYRLQLIALSLRNIISFLHVYNRIGDLSKVSFLWPHDRAAFDQAMDCSSGAKMFNFTSGIELKDVDVFTKEEILSVYALTDPDAPQKPPADDEPGSERRDG
jgi:hypothetical protein